MDKTITIVVTGHSVTGSVIAHEISGTTSLDGSLHSIVDQSGVSVPTTNGIVSNTITTTAADYIFAMTVGTSGTGNDTYSAGTSPNAFTGVGLTHPNGRGGAGFSEYFIQSASGSIAATFGVNNKDTEFYNAIAAFKPTATTVVDNNLLMTMGCGA